MPIWLNILLVLALCGLVLWGMRGLARSIDQSMENSETDEGAADGKEGEQ
ncbi:hypothetical protein [Aliiroseovarius lamellibrachiae]|nr:hypothetical protein [Aliiroseovarius lamellibrachiae]MBT2130170.1 hypothetical protein [Aliiroseovarius lamellibrachiae]